MARLAGKVALITGAAGGIGAACARLFAAEGARLVLMDRDPAMPAIDDARTFVGDVSRPDDMEDAVGVAVEGFGGLDIAILNAGIEGGVAPVADYDLETFDRVVAVNLRGVFLGLKYAMPALRARGGGSIVVTSSIAGLRGRARMPAYVASKHAVVGLMRTAALEGARDGVRVNTVHPSPVDTRMMRSLEAQLAPDDPEGFRRDYEAASPQGRYARPEEVARLMLFLAGDESLHCTGSTYRIDGGRATR